MSGLIRGMTRQRFIEYCVVALGVVSIAMYAVPFVLIFIQIFFMIILDLDAPSIATISLRLKNVPHLDDYLCYNKACFVYWRHKGISIDGLHRY